MNSAIAKQNGTNESTQTQRYDKNTASVNQDGHKNVAIQDQRTMTNMAKSEAIIHQKGMHNLAEQIQKEDNYAKTTKMVIILKLRLPVMKTAL
jgi:hypothetical protein